MGAKDQWIEDTCHWAFALYDSFVVAEGVLGCLLSTPYVSSFPLRMSAG